MVNDEGIDLGIDHNRIYQTQKFLEIEKMRKKFRDPLKIKGK